MRRSGVLAAAVLLCAATCPAVAADAPLYKVTKTVALGAPDKWDYVVFDAPSHRVFVAHGSEVTVVDATNGTVLGQVSPLPGGTHGIVSIAATGHGYTDDGKAGEAASFDLKTFAIVKKIPTAPDADGIVYDDVSGHVFVINGDSGSVTVIDPKTDSALTTIKVGGGLEFGVMDGKGKFYINGAEESVLYRVDTATNTVDAKWPVPSCTKPHGIAMDKDTRRVFMSCENRVMLAVDADSGKVIATLPIGGYTDFAVFDPIRKRVFSSNGDGTLSVFAEKDANTFVPLATVTTAISARTMGIDPATGRLYLAAIGVTKVDPPATPGGRPHIETAPGSLTLMFLDPVP
jgi:YVTN family beta-propeller protein